MRTNIAVLAFTLAVAGCGSVVPSTVARLAGLSPLDADPAGFEVGLVLPDGVGIMPNSATLGFEARRSDTGESRSETFVLERIDGDVPRWRVAREDLPAMRAFQAQAGAWEAEDPVASSGSISAWLMPCTQGDGPAPDADVSILLRLGEGAPLLPLVRNAPLADFSDAEDIAALPACP